MTNRGRRLRTGRETILVTTAAGPRDTPNGHHRVENHRRPQRHAVQFQADAGESEDGDRDEVVKQHRGTNPLAAPLRISCLPNL
jgi:hypothetical protein